MRSHVMNLWRQSGWEEYEARQKEGEICFAATTSAAGGGGGGGDSMVVQDGDSEAELCRDQLRPTPRCRRSKRIRKSRVSNNIGDMREGSGMKIKKTESSPVSSISEHNSPEEDVAYCLMLLSRDKWMKGEEEDDDENSNDSKVTVMKKTKARGKYRCESCSKVFRSYQALGGHRASHKKIKPNRNGEIGDTEKEKDEKEKKDKIHECPICYRVFLSGQALGGHKRSHFTASAAASVSSLHSSASTSTAINAGGNLIDLNLPAPLDDDDTITHIDLSAVSDACFLRPH